MSYLTEELVTQGHEVTLFASGNSMTAAELVLCDRKALRLSPTRQGTRMPQQILLDEFAGARMNSTSCISTSICSTFRCSASSRSER